MAARLNLEKSFDIALTVSDQFRSRALTDRIETIKNAKFAPMEEDEYAPGHSGFGDNMYPNNEEMLDTEFDSSFSRITPDARVRSPSSGNKRQLEREEFEVDGKKIDHPNRRAQPMAPSNFPPAPHTSNPFAKKRIESPMKRVNKSKAALVGSPSPSKPKLSRNSTFSAKSKEETRAAKRFL